MQIDARQAREGCERGAGAGPETDGPQRDPAASARSFVNTNTHATTTEGRLDEVMNFTFSSRYKNLPQLHHLYLSSRTFYLKTGLS